MTRSAMRGARRGILLLAGGLILAATPTWAQDVDDPLPQPQYSRLPPGAIVQPLDSGPGAELRRNLTALAANPRSVEALIGAGRAALGTADGQAALNFFTRAQELAPGDPRVRAGMASALVLSERPESALVTFGEAVQLGAPVDEIAGDRGLAYDMVGDPRHAQQDYALSLRRNRDPEVERRMALSLAISGQREAALRMIDGQLRRSDRAAWRTQAFILALTGDARGADDTARRMMPPTNAQALSPFFARLASLSPAQKAAAVHFGRFPSDGRAAQVAANIDTRPDPGALAMVGLSPPPAANYGQRQAEFSAPAPTRSRRRPVIYEQRADSLIRRPVRDEADAPRRIETAQAPTRRFAPPLPEPDPRTSDDDVRDSQRMTEPQPSRAYDGPRPREAPAFAPGANFTLDARHEQGAPTRPPVVFAPMQQPPIQTYQPPQPSYPPPQTRQALTPPPRTAPARPAFSDIASVVDSLPGEEARAAAAARVAPAHVETAAERRARDAAARETEARYRREGSTAARHETSRRSGAGSRNTRGRAAHDAEADTHDTHDTHVRHTRRHGETSDAPSAHGRAHRGHADESDSASTHGRSARGRHAADEPRSTRGRSGHGQDQADEPRSSRSSRNRSAGSHADESDSGSARSAHGRARHGRNTDEDSHASRSTHGRSTHSQRDSNEPRAARSRSSTQQRPAAHGRRSH